MHTSLTSTLRFGCVHDTRLKDSVRARDRSMRTPCLKAFSRADRGTNVPLVEIMKVGVERAQPVRPALIAACDEMDKGMR
jgi:hypothetical protein